MDKIEVKRKELLKERDIAFRLLQENIKNSATSTLINAVSAGIATLQQEPINEEEKLEHTEEELSKIDYIIQGLTLVKQFV